ncbi:MAG: hypothetical protein ABWY47_21510 [Xanthobacteraceae bacterium]|jgi:hypothetical protein
MPGILDLSRSNPGGILPDWPPRGPRLKTVAPKTAAAIREAVNSHPALGKIIQFNAMAGPLSIIGADPDTASLPDRLALEASP